MTQSVTHFSDGFSVNLPGASIRFRLEGGLLLGISSVSVNGAELRNPSTLWRPYFSTPEGINYGSFRFRDVEENEDGTVVVRTEAIGQPTGLREGLDEYLGDVFYRPNPGEIRDCFEWYFRPSRMELDGNSFEGFSYSYRFLCEDGRRKIYRVFDAATWEIGGSLEDNTLLFQGQLNPPVTRLGIDSHFTTACNYYGAEMRGVLGPEDRISIQRLPRFATVQAFDFLVHPQGVLYGTYEPLEEVLTLLQSEAGQDSLHFVDEIRRPLSSEFVSHPKHILFCATRGEVSREWQRNLWNFTYDKVHSEIRARGGIRRPEVLPRVWSPQVKEELFGIGGKTVPRSRALYHLADEVLPLWAEMGVREICTPSLWCSDYTVDRVKTKEESGGLQGELVVSGICCVRVHEIDALWGGTEALAYFVRKAHALGMKVQVWWASHLSRRAPIYEERPDFMLMARDGLPNGGGFGHNILVTLDLNNLDCFEWEFNKLKTLYEATGIDGLFHDSYGNMTFLALNFSDEQRVGQQAAYEKFLGRLQALGMTSFSVEGIGACGTGHFGMNLLDTSEGAAGQYQNAVDWWVGEEDMVYGLNMGIEQTVWPGREDEARRFAFKCMASGGRFGFTAMRNNIELWDGWLKEQNQLHARLGALTGKRTLLEDGKGVLWQQPDGMNILFVYKSMQWPLSAKCETHEVTAGGEVTAAGNNGFLLAEAGQVYRWRAV